MPKFSQAIEDYLKHIYLLQEQNPDAPVSGQHLAVRLKVSQPSVTAMLKRMHELRLVEHTAYRGVELTEQGRLIALEVIRHHRLIEAYLAQVVGMAWDEVHDEAEVLEHHISEQLEELMAKHLGNPSFDPHGHPIPTLEGELPARAGLRALSALEAGEVGVVRCIRNENPELLRFLQQIELMPERQFTVHARGPLGDTVTIVNETGTTHAIGREIASSIDVTST